MRTVVGAIVVRELYLKLFCYLLCQPDIFPRSYQASQALHHVLFYVTVKQEVSFQSHATGVGRRIALQLFESARQAQRGRYDRVRHERLHRTEAVYIGGPARWRGQLPSRGVRVEVVPDCTQIQIE